MIIWTNLTGFNPKLCKKDCDNLGGNSGRHKINIGHYNFVKDGDNIISFATNELRDKYRGYEQI